MIELLNNYFIPLYVENEEASDILLSKGKRPYVGQEWQLVQTHLILPSGALQELWRPGHNTGRDDPINLHRALQGAVEQLDLKASARPSKPYNAVQDDPEGAVLEVTLRFPKQENFPRDHAFTIDWIQLTAEELALLTSTENVPRALPADLAADVLVHFRPPLDEARDPTAKALASVTHSALKITKHEQQADRNLLMVEGQLQMRDSVQVIEDHNDKWSRILKGDLAISGYIELESTGELADIQLLLASAAFTPPQGKKIHYQGFARLVR